MERVTEKECGSSTSSSKSSKPIPDSVMEAVKRTSKNIDDLSSNVDELLSLYGADAFPEMGPLQQAQSLILLAKATTTLFALRLRCKGINPDEHPVKLEFERLSLYQEKLQGLMDLNKAPLRPSARINPQAATRFIEHSLPDLTPEQRKNMIEISKGDGPRIKCVERIVHKKRKYPEQQSVRTATQEFLEKAARELLGENQSGFKGPLQLPEVDGEDVPMS
ncbi:hypothetical protein FXO38_12197 [Capsicum annuum]|uniref:Nuclear nucleic acid-binding protein C1D n=1 Tax=Capsicum annuum TaxID=4072 RepID=A0A1U8H9W1_CAPAN|nr:nuclear nucleic acid-binding protein C1D [Capsicum annuum]XP_047249765.1 nuclear nucleic acid-binding protein C1D [Capsicum annuum]KAF3623557.1 hypothetical protein FXO37_31824 [Capsicum annuum]KAF3660308.1 hypothetical protein FXO38_12197 [Capsicum annuum]PHT75825.1 hypothetical protein T459_19347 [Capsicum annuum]